MNVTLLKPREVDLLFRYPAGRSLRLAIDTERFNVELEAEKKDAVYLQGLRKTIRDAGLAAMGVTG